MESPNLTTFPTLVGTCVDDYHPEREGFHEVEYVAEDGTSVRGWFAALQHVRPKKGDEVLLSQPRNRVEPIVVGVIGPSESAENDKSGFEVRANNVVVLRGDEPIQVVTHDGRKLVEIGKSLNGPTIRICQRDAAINLPGSLSISAGELKLRSHSGDVQIDADREVVIAGDLIRLN